MKHAIDAEPMDSHRLHHGVATLLVSLVAVALIGVEHDRLGRLMRDNLTNSAVLREASVALVKLLHDAELLSLSDARTSLPAWAFAEVFELHMLQHDAVEAHAELLLGEVRLTEHGNFQDRLLFLDRPWRAISGRHFRRTSCRNFFAFCGHYLLLFLR